MSRSVPHDHVSSIECIDQFRDACSRVSAISVDYRDRLPGRRLHPGLQRRPVAQVSLVAYHSYSGILGDIRGAVVGSIINHQDLNGLIPPGSHALEFRQHRGQPLSLPVGGHDHRYAT